MRRIKARRDIPGIALSGFGMDDDIAKSLAAGFVAHLTKPVDFPKLEATIRSMAR
jgi:CheY-like chemotaxis protein